VIIKIDKLKNFGIYKNFAWNRLDKFKQENLIYGWNYSGKTTFSNLFQNLEFRDKDKCFSGSEFSITTEQNNVNTNHCQDDLENFPYDVKVFNSSYIKRIFTFDFIQTIPCKVFINTEIFEFIYFYYHLRNYFEIVMSVFVAQRLQKQCAGKLDFPQENQAKQANTDF